MSAVARQRTMCRRIHDSENLWYRPNIRKSVCTKSGHIDQYADRWTRPRLMALRKLRLSFRPTYRFLVCARLSGALLMVVIVAEYRKSTRDMRIIVAAR